MVVILTLFLGGTLLKYLNKVTLITVKHKKHLWNFFEKIYSLKILFYPAMDQSPLGAYIDGSHAVVV